MSKREIFACQNIDRNVKLEEIENGLKMYYTLSVPKNFPNITFISKNKAYHTKTMTIPYGVNMSKRINYAYEKLKVHTMCELAEFKVKIYTEKHSQLLTQKNQLKPYGNN